MATKKASYDFDLADDDDEEGEEMASPAPAPKAKVRGEGGSFGWIRIRRWQQLSAAADRMHGLRAALPCCG